MSTRALLLLLLLCQRHVLADEFNTRLRLQGQAEEASHSTLFPAESHHSSFSALDINAQSYGGIQLAATAWYQDMATQSESSLQLAELFYDFPLDDWQLSAGKKKLDWGVGYGFRPLDLFSPTDPLALYTAVAPGTWQLSGDWFDDNGSLTLVCNQSQPYYRIAGQRQERGNGCGMRRYRYLGAWELQTIAHYDSRLKWRLGASAVSVLTDALEFHTSVLWQQDYLGADFIPSNLMADTFTNPVESKALHSAWQTLVGINYSSAWGATLIAEYWYDGRSPSDHDWQSMLEGLDAQAQSNNPLTPYHLAAQQQLFASQNLFRNTLMVHLRGTGDQWRPELTMLLNPIDKGLSVHSKLCYYLRSGTRLELGVKRYTGGADSAYRQLVFDTTYYLGAELVF